MHYIKHLAAGLFALFMVAPLALAQKPVSYSTGPFGSPEQRFFWIVQCGAIAQIVSAVIAILILFVVLLRFGQIQAELKKLRSERQ